MKELQALEEGEENEMALLRKNKVVFELERILLMEEISYRQKLRAIWLKKRNKCPKFFHTVAISH